MPRTSSLASLVLTSTKAALTVMVVMTLVAVFFAVFMLGVWLNPYLGLEGKPKADQLWPQAFATAGLIAAAIGAVAWISTYLIYMFLENRRSRDNSGDKEIQLEKLQTQASHKGAFSQAKEKTERSADVLVQLQQTTLLQQQMVLLQQMSWGGQPGAYREMMDKLVEMGQSLAQSQAQARKPVLPGEGTREEPPSAPTLPQQMSEGSRSTESPVQKIKEPTDEVRQPDEGILGQPGDNQETRDKSRKVETLVQSLASGNPSVTRSQGTHEEPAPLNMEVRRQSKAETEYWQTISEWTPAKEVLRIKRDDLVAKLFPNSTLKENGEVSLTVMDLAPFPEAAVGFRKSVLYETFIPWSGDAGELRSRLKEGASSDLTAKPPRLGLLVAWKYLYLAIHDELTVGWFTLVREGKQQGRNARLPAGVFDDVVKTLRVDFKVDTWRNKDLYGADIPPDYVAHVEEELKTYIDTQVKEAVHNALTDPRPALIAKLKKNSESYGALHQALRIRFAPEHYNAVLVVISKLLDSEERSAAWEPTRDLQAAYLVTTTYLRVLQWYVDHKSMDHTS